MPRRVLESPVMTLNAMGRCMEGEPRIDWFAPLSSSGSICRDQLPEVFELPLTAS